MSDWMVSVKVIGDATIFVEAETKEEAIDKALSGDWQDEMDVGSLEIITRRFEISAESSE